MIFFSMDLQCWLHINIYINAPVSFMCDGDWPEFWATTCHAIWEWCNIAKHNDNFSRPYDLLGMIADRMRDYNLVACNNCIMDRKMVE